MDSLLSMEKSLDSLEEALKPLFENNLSQTLSELDLLRKAKLQVLLPYVVNDLVFIYLKTRGINPKTHPVVEELDRIKAYFDKIKKAEDPEKRRFAVDQGAATRFIKHTIKESQASRDASQRYVKRGTHTRFISSDTTIIESSASAAATAKINARASKNQREESSSEENDLEVFTDDPNPENFATEYPTGNQKARKETMETSMSKKRRRGMDPWAGYDESENHTPSAKAEDERQQKKTKEDQPSSSVTPKTVGGLDSQAIDMGALDSSRSSTPVQGNSKRKKRKKQNTSALAIN